MSFCSKCGKEIKEGGEFCPNCGTKIEVPHKIDSSVSVAEQAKIEGVKQRIAEYNRNYIGFMIMMIVAPTAGVFFWSKTLYFTKVADVDCTDLQVISILLWILGILCLVASVYYHSQATKLREKLEKGEID